MSFHNVLCNRSASPSPNCQADNAPVCRRTQRSAVDCTRKFNPFHYHTIVGGMKEWVLATPRIAPNQNENAKSHWLVTTGRLLRRCKRLPRTWCRGTQSTEGNTIPRVVLYAINIIKKLWQSSELSTARVMCPDTFTASINIAFNNVVETGNPSTNCDVSDTPLFNTRMTSTPLLHRLKEQKNARASF